MLLKMPKGSWPKLWRQKRKIKCNSIKRSALPKEKDQMPKAPIHWREGSISNLIPQWKKYWIRGTYNVCEFFDYNTHASCSSSRNIGIHTGPDCQSYRTIGSICSSILYKQGCKLSVTRTQTYQEGGFCFLTLCSVFYSLRLLLLISKGSGRWSQTWVGFWTWGMLLISDSSPRVAVYEMLNWTDGCMARDRGWWRWTGIWGQDGQINNMSNHL